MVPSIKTLGRVAAGFLRALRDAARHIIVGMVLIWGAVFGILLLFGCPVGIAGRIASFAALLFAAAMVMFTAIGCALALRTTVLRRASGATTISAPPLKKGMFGGRKIPVDIGSISTEDVTKVLTACETAESRRWSTLEVRIDSPGGDADSAFAIATLLSRAARRMSVRIIVLDQCSSAAITILTSVPIECRYSLPYSRFMIHATRCGGRRNKATKRLDARYAGHIADATYCEPKDLHQIMKRGNDCFFGADEALTLGFIGGII
jgi:ATP-dependent protease ClpP protease subunit